MILIKKLDFHIKELDLMNKYPKELFYIGDTNLLKKRKISIVGARRPNQYSRIITHELASKLSQEDICIISGGAMGIDTIAHNAATVNNTIMVAGTGLDKRYPSINKKLIQGIENKGLVLSPFKIDTPSLPYNFPIRNEIVVALGEVLIVSFADANSGTIRSVEFAIKMNIPIYVLPHRIHESKGSNQLLKNNLAKAIYNVEEFIELFSSKKINKISDGFLLYCKSNPTFDEALLKFKDKVYQYELDSKIKVVNGKIEII